MSATFSTPMSPSVMSSTLPDTITISTTVRSATSNTAVYPQAIILPILSGLAILLTLPPLIQHIKCRNLTLTVLIASMSLLNLQNTINPLIWPNDQTQTWWSGHGLCDVEAKLQVGLSVSVPGAAACICRQLALILNTGRTNSMTSGGDDLNSLSRRKTRAFEVTFCFVLPVYAMTVHILVQPYRYFIYGISGCRYAMHSSYMSNVLVLVWPVISCLVGTVYSGIVVVRLVRCYRQISTILSTTVTSEPTGNARKSRFVRLLLIAAVFVLVYTPLAVFAFVKNLYVGESQQAWSWSDVHPAFWDQMIQTRPSHGQAGFDRWIQVVTSFVIFLVFGLAKDTKLMYRRWIEKMQYVWSWSSCWKRHMVTEDDQIQSAGYSLSKTGSRPREHTGQY